MADFRLDAITRVAMSALSLVAYDDRITSYNVCYTKLLRVTITGTNYSTTIADNEVYVGSLKAIITACTATSITFTIPTGAVSGTIKVVLKNGEQVLSATNLVILGSPSFTSTPVTTIGYNETYNYNVDATTEGSLTTSITAPTLPAWFRITSYNVCYTKLLRQ